MTDQMSTDALELYCRNRARATGELTEYDRALLMDVSARLCAIQSENAKLRKQRPVQVDGDVMALTLELAETKAALSRVEAERDAMAALIKKSALKPIQECKHYAECYQEAADEMRMMRCPVCDNWEWRGPQGEG